MRESRVNEQCDPAERIVLPRLLDVLAETQQKRGPNPIFAAVDIQDAFNNVPLWHPAVRLVSPSCARTMVSRGKFLVPEVLKQQRRLALPTTWWKAHKRRMVSRLHSHRQTPGPGDRVEQWGTQVHRSQRQRFQGSPLIALASAFSCLARGHRLHFSDIRAAPLANPHALSVETAQTPKAIERSLPSSHSGEAREPRETIHLPEEMIDEINQPSADAEHTREFVANAPLRGKVHRVVAHSPELHAHHRRSKRGWYFGRGMKSYALLTMIRQGRVCQICFSSETGPCEDDPPCHLAHLPPRNTDDAGKHVLQAGFNCAGSTKSVG